jgi:hypothetical protein
MAYTLLRRATRCFECRTKNEPLFYLHGSSGLLVGILCAACAQEWGNLPGVTASPVGNLRPRHRRRRFGHLLGG